MSIILLRRTNIENHTRILGWKNLRYNDKNPKKELKVAKMIGSKRIFVKAKGFSEITSMIYALIPANTKVLDIRTPFDITPLYPKLPVHCKVI